MTSEYFEGKFINTVIKDSVSLPYFGIFTMSIVEAAERVVLDMWFSGDFSNIKEPDDWDNSVDDPRLKMLLANEIAKFKIKLQIAVDSGKLEPVKITRNLDELLIPEKTYITYQNLYKWLLDRGYECSDTLKAWIDSEMDIAIHLCEELAYLRSININGKYEFESFSFHGSIAKNDNINQEIATDVVAAYKALVIENKYLEEQLARTTFNTPAHVDRPIERRERRSLLIVIAALCKQLKIDTAGRDTTGLIVKLTEFIGIKISDDSIRQYLSEVPEALQSRMKDEDKKSGSPSIKTSAKK